MEGMTLSQPGVVRGRVVTPEAVVEDGVVVHDGADIRWVGAVERVPAELAEVTARTVPHEGYVLPGLVDLHCHGGGGASFPDAVDAETARTAVGEHLRHGTTSMVASLVTAEPAVLRERTMLLAGLAEAGEIAGIHFEGPFIAAERCGAQNPAAIQLPDPELTAELLALGRGHVVTMTVAPEAPGVDDVVRVLAEGGALPSFGHTVASAARAREAVRGATEVLAGAPAARIGDREVGNGLVIGEAVEFL